MLLAVPVGALLVVKRLDEENRFCIACHLHQDLYRAMVGPPPTTLASAHFRVREAPDGGNAAAAAHPAGRRGHPERCFTCHSGEGVVGWTQVTALSAWDAARWVLGDRHEPESMRLPLTNQACLKCHAADVRGTKSEEETSKYHELTNHRSVSMPCASVRRLQPGQET